MGEDKRAALPRRVPHDGGPRIPHDSSFPPDPAQRPGPGPGAAALLAQLRSEAGTAVDQEAGPADAQAEPGYRGAFDPVRPAAASPRPRVCEDVPRPAVRARPSRPATWTQPSWPAVLATTARLWLARHMHRPGRGLRLACLTVLILAINTAAGLVAAQQDLLGTYSGSQVSARAPAPSPATT